MINREPSKYVEPQGSGQLKGKHADKMTQMLEKSSNKEETFMKQIADMLEANKKKYDQ